MVVVKVVVHPEGLGPKEAAKAWYSMFALIYFFVGYILWEGGGGRGWVWNRKYMRVVQKMKFDDVRKKVKNMQGKTPKSKHCVENAVQRVKASGKKGVSF